MGSDEWWWSIISVILGHSWASSIILSHVSRIESDWDLVSWGILWLNFIRTTNISSWRTAYVDLKEDPHCMSRMTILSKNCESLRASSTSCPPIFPFDFFFIVSGRSWTSSSKKAFLIINRRIAALTWTLGSFASISWLSFCHNESGDLSSLMAKSRTKLHRCQWWWMQGLNSGPTRLRGH